MRFSENKLNYKFWVMTFAVIAKIQFSRQVGFLISRENRSVLRFGHWFCVWVHYVFYEIVGFRLCWIVKIKWKVANFQKLTKFLVKKKNCTTKKTIFYVLKTKFKNNIKPNCYFLFNNKFKNKPMNFKWIFQSFNKKFKYKQLLLHSRL